MNKIEFGDCRVIMKRWKEEGVKVQTCVTSPPYFGLRDYGVDGQIGLEQTIGEYVANMVDVFRHVWHILEDDGTVWLNLGDSYARTGGDSSKKGRHWDGRKNNPNTGHNRFAGDIGLKAKDLIGIPWRVAFALQDFGWYLRQDIIWHKPNPMPESVTDRCTKSHEYIFLLTKKPQYYFNNEAIKESCINSAEEQIAKRNKKQHRENASKEEAKYVQHNFSKVEKIYEKRNKRDVWSVTVKPYKGAHFATFPKDLIEPCVLAGSKIGDIVFDPFMGSGTTAQVALDNDRQYLGCELNPEYKELQDERLNRLL
jgi:DNA modification methylase